MTVSINLLPWREEQKEIEKKYFLIRCALSLIAGAILVAIIHAGLSMVLSDQLARNQDLKNEIQILEKKNQAIQSIDKEKKQLLDRIEIIQDIRCSRHIMAHILDTVARSVPEGVELKHLQKKKDLIIIDGSALSNDKVSVFMRQIEQSEWIKNPQLTVIENKDGHGTAAGSKESAWVSFNIQGAVPLIDEVSPQKQPLATDHKTAGSHSGHGEQA